VIEHDLRSPRADVATDQPGAAQTLADRPAIDHTLGAERSFVGLPGLKVGVLHWRAADATPLGEVVLLHGLSGSAATQAPMAATLAQAGWSVRALDLPGHGWSHWVDEDGGRTLDPDSVEAAAYGLDRVARAIAAALRALALTPPVALIGHSWGAGVAAAAILEGAPVSRVVLVDPPFLTAEGSADLTAELVAELRPDPDAALSVASELEPGADPIALAARAEALTQASELAIMAAASETGYGPFEFLARWRAARPNVRVDAIVGDPKNGGLVPTRARLALRLVLGRGRVHYLREAGHSPMESHFPQFMALLAGLLAAPTTAARRR
jgi:pimeloyl-ACP methyl ester carboxylesterase